MRELKLYEDLVPLLDDPQPMVVRSAVAAYATFLKDNDSNKEVFIRMPPATGELYIDDSYLFYANVFHQ